MSEQYTGMFLNRLESKKERKQHASHPIFLYDPEVDKTPDDIKHLDQIVNIYKHNIYDFEFNSKKIIKHYMKYYGNTDIGLFTLGQSITFRVYEKQEPMQLPLFKFLMNYTMLILPIIMKADMKKWKPWLPSKWTSNTWCNQMDLYIKHCRHLGNMRKLCECIEMSKYLMNLFAAKAGDRIALSISNNDFIEIAKRSDEARKSLTCSFPIPDDITPKDLETLVEKRTGDLMQFIGEQKDLPISVYVNNGLFNKKQFSEFAVHMGHKPDLSGNTIPYASNTNIIMGIRDPRAFMIDAAGGRKAEVLKLKVSDAGALERSLAMVMSQCRFVDLNYECDSKHFRKRYIDGNEVLNNLEGRVCTLDPESDEYLIIDPDNTKLIGTTVYLKTPITCTHPRRQEGYICSACYGKLMASLNCDVHIGRLVALESADEIEQKLLGAKHALKTNTVDISFNENFDTYFDTVNCQIFFNANMIESSLTEQPEFDHLFLEFNPKVMIKHQDGEMRHYDRSINEIVVYNDIDETHTVIDEDNGIMLFLTPEFVENYFLPEIQKHDKKETIYIPFNEIIDKGKVCCTNIFEYQYKNNELSSPLIKLERILGNGSAINSYENYDECLNDIIPLFRSGGIHLPEFQTEMLISQMIRNPDGGWVDWTQDNPEYKFMSIKKSIQHMDSAITSILYEDSSRQIAGLYDTYNKSGTSAYDNFIIDK